MNIDRVISLLSGPQPNWRSLSGRVRNWHNGPLLDQGRAQWHAQRGRVRNSGKDPEDTEAAVTRESQFLATREPWRVRLDWRDEESPLGNPSVLVVGDADWWTSDGSVTLTNAGDPEYQMGTGELSVLLRPIKLPEGYRFRRIESVEVMGRIGVRVSTQPKEDLAWAAPELVVLGSSQHDLVIDSELGIVVQWEAYIHDSLARSSELSRLEIDREIDESLFEPPPDLPVLPPSRWPADWREQR